MDAPVRSSPAWAVQLTAPDAERAEVFGTQCALGVRVERWANCAVYKLALGDDGFVEID